ncbi:MAG: hypothetical protein J6M35_06735 [Clostridia bacterium]|nr:hypothetical protein [Clostridia bacterium]
MSKRRFKLSKISALHYFKLFFRSFLLIAATVLYIIGKVKHSDDTFGGYEKQPAILAFIWVVFVIEMILRFFPSKLESMGCQKQFKKNFIPTESDIPKNQPFKITLLVAIVWILLNGAIGALYFAGIIDRGILLLVSLAYSVCDMICILFFCPFQTWFMKNKCCGSCRIYNWDYIMMFTPLVFIKNIYALSLVAIAFALFVCWELSFYIHPKRFSEETNACLSCANCKEKLCHHKKQLRGFLKKNRHLFSLSGNRTLGKILRRNDKNK